MDWEAIIWTIVIILGITITIGSIGFITYQHSVIKYDNFQTTIADLSDEQKCIHICGFEWSGNYLENYKFCMEKCDRISEREAGCGLE